MRGAPYRWGALKIPLVLVDLGCFLFRNISIMLNPPPETAPQSTRQASENVGLRPQPTFALNRKGGRYRWKPSSSSNLSIRAQIRAFRVLFIILELDKQFPVEQFEATVPSPPLVEGANEGFPDCRNRNLRAFEEHVQTAGSERIVTERYLRSVFKMSCLFLRPRPWQFEI